MIKSKLEMLQHIKTLKKSISKFHFPVKLYEIWKNFMIQYYFLHKHLQIWIVTFFHKMHIFLFNLKTNYWESKIQFFNNNMWNTKKTYECKVVRFKKIYKFCLTQFLKKHIFFVSIQKNTIKIQEFHFLYKIYEIHKKLLDVKLFAWMRSTHSY